MFTGSWFPDLKHQNLIVDWIVVSLQESQRTNQRPIISHVSIKKTTLIPSQHMIRLTAMIPGGSIGSIGVLRPSPQFLQQHDVLVAQAISRNEEGRTVMELLSPTFAPIIVHANEKVGMFHPMEATDEVCNLFDAHTITPTSSCCNYTSYSKLPIQDTLLEHKIHLLLARTEAKLDPPHQERLKCLLYHYHDVISTGGMTWEWLKLPSPL